MESILDKLDIKKFDQVYFGKQGCACGCGGNYHTTERMFKTALTKMKKLVKEGNKLTLIKSSPDIIGLEFEERAIRIYTNQKVVEEDTGIIYN